MSSTVLTGPHEEKAAATPQGGVVSKQQLSRECGGAAGLPHAGQMCKVGHSLWTRGS